MQVFFPKKLEIFFQTPLHQLRGKKIDLSGGVDGRSGNTVGRDLGICRVRERDEGQALPRHGQGILDQRTTGCDVCRPARLGENVIELARLDTR